MTFPSEHNSSKNEFFALDFTSRVKLCFLWKFSSGTEAWKLLIKLLKSNFHSVESIIGWLCSCAASGDEGWFASHQLIDFPVSDVPLCDCRLSHRWAWTWLMRQVASLRGSLVQFSLVPCAPEYSAKPFCCMLSSQRRDYMWLHSDRPWNVLPIYVACCTSL